MKKILLLLTFVNYIYAVSIVDTVNFTLKNSEKLRIYEVESKISQKDVQKKRASFYPTVDLYINSKKTKNITKGEFIKDNSSGADVKLNIFNGLKDLSNLEASQNEYNAKKSTYKHQQNKISLDAIKSHLNIVYQNKLYEIELENIRQDKELLRISKSISKVIGDTTPTIEVKTDLDYAKSAANEAYKDVGGSLFEYKMYTNKSFSAKEFSWPMVDENLLTDIYKKIKNQNNLIQNYAYQMKKLDNELEAKQGEFRPKVDLVGNYNRNGVRGSSENKKSLKLEFKYNIFNGYYNESELEQKKLEKMKVILQKQEAIKKIIKDTDTVKHTTKVYKSLIKQNKDTLKSLMNLRALYLKQFSIGKRQINDIIDLQKKIVNIKKDLVKNEYSVKLNYFYILSYTGELVSFVTKKPLFAKVDSLSDTDITYSLKEGDKEKVTNDKAKKTIKRVTHKVKKSRKITHNKHIVFEDKPILDELEKDKKRVSISNIKPAKSEMIVISNKNKIFEYKNYKEAKKAQQNMRGSSIVMTESGKYQVLKNKK